MLADESPPASPAADPCESPHLRPTKAFVGFRDAYTEKHLSPCEAAVLAQSPLAHPQSLPPYVYDKADNYYPFTQLKAGLVPPAVPDDCNDAYMRRVMPQRDRRARFRRIFEEYMTEDDVLSLCTALKVVAHNRRTYMPDLRLLLVQHLEDAENACTFQEFYELMRPLLRETMPAVLEIMLRAKLSTEVFARVMYRHMNRYDIAVLVKKACEMQCITRKAVEDTVLKGDRGPLEQLTLLLEVIPTYCIHWVFVHFDQIRPTALADLYYVLMREMNVTQLDVQELRKDGLYHARAGVLFNASALVQKSSVFFHLRPSPTTSYHEEREEMLSSISFISNLRRSLQVYVRNVSIFYRKKDVIVRCLVAAYTEKSMKSTNPYAYLARCHPAYAECSKSGKLYALYLTLTCMNKSVEPHNVKRLREAKDIETFVEALYQCMSKITESELVLLEKQFLDAFKHVSDAIAYGPICDRELKRKRNPETESQEPVCE